MRAQPHALRDFGVAELDVFCAGRFFTSATFAELWAAKGGRPVIWTLTEGDRTVAILPGVEFGRAFLRRFMSMPDGCYGGVLCHPEHQADAPRLVAALTDAVLQAGYMRTFIFDFDGHMGCDPRFEAIRLQTTLVDISNPDWLPPDKKLVSQIRKAEREGIVVGPMHWPEHGERFLALMHHTEKRHGKNPSFDRAFFERLAEAATVDDRLHWVWCEHEGQGVCSHIYIIEQGMLQGWQIYFDKAYSFLKPNQYIRFQTCRRMARRGICWLNLGGTPENAPGLSYYKKRWGGDLYSYRGLVNKQGLGRFL